MAQLSPAAPAAVAFPPVVDASEVASCDDIVLCDVRWYLDGRSGYDAYLAGHIPGAIWVDLQAHLASPGTAEQGRHPMISAEQFAASLGSLGIGPQDPVVAYDDQHGTAAGRMVWMLRVLGHDAALLDGGLAHWSGTLETKPSVRAACDCGVRAWPDHAFADIDAAAAVAESTQAVLVDARQPNRYSGEAEPIDPRAGHIPGAVNVPTTENLGPDGRFATPEALRSIYEAKGIQLRPTQDAVGSASRANVNSATLHTTAPNNAVVYCGSGVSACMDALAMERAGLGRPQLYVGSWSQWSHTSRPAGRC